MPGYSSLFTRDHTSYYVHYIMPAWVASRFTSQSYGRSATLTLQATHEKTLEHVPLETLMRYAIDADEAQAELARIDGLRAQLAKGVSFEAE